MLRKLDIFEAIKKGDKATTLECLDSGCDVNMKDKEGNTLLMISCCLPKPEHLDITALLLSRGADLKIENRDSNRALHRAAQLGTPQSLKLLLDHEADVNVYGGRALCYAVEEGQEENVKLLLEYKVNPMEKCRYTTPLSIALEKNRTEIIKFLVRRAGCDLLTQRLGSLYFDENKPRPFVFEIMNKKQEADLIHPLLQETKELETFLKKATSVKELNDRLSRWDLRPGINESSFKNFQLIIDYNIVQDYSHLMTCFFDNIDPYFSDIPRECVEGEGYHYKEWEILCMSNDLRAVDYAFKQRWVDEKSCNQMGMTILEFAGCIGSTELVKHLITKHKCNPDSKSALLHYAAGRGHLPLIKYLIEERIVLPCCLDKNGDNALVYAAQGGQVDTLRYFLDELPEGRRLDVKVRTSRSVGLLHYAIEGFDIPTMIFLIQRGVPQFTEISTNLDPEKLFKEYRFCLGKLVSDPDSRIESENLQSDSFPNFISGLRRIYRKYKAKSQQLPENYQGFLKKSSLAQIIYDAKYSKEVDELCLKQQVELEAERAALRTSTQGVFKIATPGIIPPEVKQRQTDASPIDHKEQLNDLKLQLARALEKIDKLEQQLKTVSTPSKLALG